MKQILILSLLIFFPLMANADPVEIDGIWYNLDSELKTAAVSQKPSGYYSGDIIIPEKLKYNGAEYIVTCIGFQAFYRCSDLTSITLPNSVTIISGSAFYGCQGIVSITIPSNVERLEHSTFNNCTHLTSVSLPRSLKYIGWNAFRNCKELTSIDIPSGTTTIDNAAFENCFSLTSITIPKSVSSISITVFDNCPSLSSINVESGNPYYDSRNDCNAIIETSSNTLIAGCMNTIIPSDVTSIGLAAFSNCTNLSSITIPSSVTSIGYSAFSYCTGITSITIPSTVKKIDLYAFSGCSGLTSISVENGNEKYDSRDNCNAIIETSSNKLITGCMNTIIPNSVTTIGDDAFACCSNLATIIIPNNVTTIEPYAFRYCDHLTSITIPNGLTYIGEGAFFFCSGLASVSISESVKSIGMDAFYGCNNLSSIMVESGNKKYDSRNNCNALIETSSNKLLYGCMNTIIPNSVTTIGYYSFADCSGLSSVTIPASVTVIEDYAFADCINLLDVYSYSKRAPSTNFSFAGIELSNSTLHVPASSIEIYKNATEWQDFGKIVALTDDDPNPTRIESSKEDKISYTIETYTIDGKRIPKPQRGLNIIKMSDGTTKKMFIK